MTSISTAQLTWAGTATAVSGEGQFSGASSRSVAEELERVGALDNNWDGRGSECPNDHALGTARRFVDLMEDRRLVPERVVASSDGGVEFYFLPPASYGNDFVVVEILNEGGVVGSSVDLQGQLDVWEYRDDQLEAVAIRVKEGLGY